MPLMSTYEDITGNRSGKLTAIKRINNKGVGKWLCRCDCGNKCVIAQYNFRRTYSCGCRKGSVKKDITHKKFGKLTAIKPVGKTKGLAGCYIWRCKCSCGNIVNVSISYLTTGSTKSCGCLHTAAIITKGTVLSPKDVPDELLNCYQLLKGIREYIKYK